MESFNNFLQDPYHDFSFHNSHLVYGSWEDTLGTSNLPTNGVNLTPLSSLELDGVHLGSSFLDLKSSSTPSSTCSCNLNSSVPDEVGGKLASKRVETRKRRENGDSSASKPANSTDECDVDSINSVPKQKQEKSGTKEEALGASLQLRCVTRLGMASVCD